MIIFQSDLPKIRERHRKEKIVFCSGSFDLTHAGHILFLEDCKKQGDVIVVMIGRDEELQKNKGVGRPLLNEQIRLKTVASFRTVDYCLLNGSPPKKHPLDFLTIAFDLLKPDAYAVNDDAFDIPYRQKTAGQYNVKMIIMPRWCPPEFENISTTKIIEKIQNLPREPLKP